MKAVRTRPLGPAKRPAAVAGRPEGGLAEHKATGQALLEAYQSVGGVLGALAREAEKVRTKLSADDQAQLESIFVRLVRLGDTGGATRRTAASMSSTARGKRCCSGSATTSMDGWSSVAETSAEIAHEALITQWPWLQRR